MGCDVHAHIEVKVKGEWHHYSNPPVRRNYDLFRLMGNESRDDRGIIPVAKIKGLPNDISVITKMDWNRRDDDWHHASWLNGDELICLEDRLKEAFKQHEDVPDIDFDVFKTFIFGNSITGIARYPEETRPEFLEDVRLVFWFDS